MATPSSAAVNPSSHPVPVAVLIVCYNGRADIEACLASVLASNDPGLHTRVLVVDNASADGSADLVAQRFPQVELLRLSENHGFTGGNNRGWAHIQRIWPDTIYLALLNQDTLVADGWLTPLVRHLDEHPEVGAVQPKLLLHPETDRFNTVGNRSHFLGFGYVSAYRERDQGQYDQPTSIDYASGAAVMIRTALLQRVGLFEEGLFLYLEDAELSWKLRQIGFDTHYVPGIAVYHKYTFRTTLRAYYYLERNRWWLLAVYYRWPTLLLILPALLLMEAGQCLFALGRGMLRQKLRAWGYFLNIRHLRHLWAQRRAAQRRRTAGDRACMARFSGVIRFPDASPPLLRYVANPIFNVYWQVVRRLIFW